MNLIPYISWINLSVLFGILSLHKGSVFAEVVISPVNVSVTENNPVTLTCSLTGTTETPSSFSWYMKTTQADSVAVGVLTSSCQSVIVPINTSLYSYTCSTRQSTWTIKKVTRQNHGDGYQCNIDKASGVANSGYTFLNVQGIQHACTQVTSDLQHRNGDNVSLPCSLMGTYTFPQWRGPPSLTIYTNQDDTTGIINPAAPAASRLSYASNKQDLIITNVTVYDSGEYQCKYTGIGDHTISLKITEGGDPCLINPCVNGTCFSHGSMFLCQCSQGFTGKLCEKAVDPCEPNPCVHGTCFSHGSLFLCQCSPGYTGKTCQECDDPCRNKPCVHGSCFSHRTSFICQCPGGYTGKLCEKTDVKDPVIVG